MQIHRSRHTCGFTVLPNVLLQDRRLSYTARGLLADLLSRPDGWSEDGRRMADTSPQGRIAVAKALRELAAFGYYRVLKVRRDDGTFFSEAHVYDTPQRPDTSAALACPAAGPELNRPAEPAPGEPGSGASGSNPVKDRREKPSLPGPLRRRRQRSSAADPVDARLADAGADASAGGAHGAAVAVLLRVVGAEPRLRLGVVEALALAPLVSAWLERGYGERDLAGALLGGLPARIHSVSAFLGDRLTRKLPPALEPPRPGRSGPAVAHWAECGECGRPVPHEGVCRACAVSADRPGGPGVGGPRPDGSGPDDSRSGDFRCEDFRSDDDSARRARTAARGRALVRAALGMRR